MTLIITIGYVFAGLFAFQFVGLAFAIPFYNFDWQLTLQNVATNPLGDTGNRVPLLILQGVVAGGTFVGVPWLVIRRHLKLEVKEFFTFDKNYEPLLLVFAIVFTFMGVNSLFIDWNMNIQLPESMRAMEVLMQDMEEQLKLLTEHLIVFDSFGHFLLGLAVIAVLPGIGEELLFRGLFQNIFHKAFGNPHVAIWLAAIIFGVFHFQFYGLVPRILLGALFGYLYYYSGHLGYAMFAHFVNNGSMILVAYLSQLGIINFDMTTMDQSPEIWAVGLFAVLTTLLFVRFYRYFKNQKNGLAENI
ncbi:MAG: membrane protease YdiL (CAAX protease family) [Cyclobacteriaceae bacterium]